MGEPLDFFSQLDDINSNPFLPQISSSSVNPRNRCWQYILSELPARTFV